MIPIHSQKGLVGCRMTNGKIGVAFLQWFLTITNTTAFRRWLRGRGLKRTNIYSAGLREGRSCIYISRLLLPERLPQGPSWPCPLSLIPNSFTLVSYLYEASKCLSMAGLRKSPSTSASMLDMGERCPECASTRRRDQTSCRHRQVHSNARIRCSTWRSALDAVEDLAMEYGEQDAAAAEAGYGAIVINDAI